MRDLSRILFGNSELLYLILVSAIALLIVFLVFLLVPKKRKRRLKPKTSSLSFVRPSKRTGRMTRKDRYLLTSITVVYAVISFWHAGTFRFPVTTWQPSVTEGTQEAVFELQDETKFDAVYAIYGEGDNNSNPDTYQCGFHHMYVFGSGDGENWHTVCELNDGRIYRYMIQEGEWDFRYIKVVSSDKNDTLSEIALRSGDHFVNLTVKEDKYGAGDYPASLMTDEQNKIPLYPTYTDQGYFDEVYHPRNAWEIANGQRMYASVHPLLGTNLMALSIKIFGMSPLAWRLPGLITGVLMVPLMYMILHLMFEITLISFGGTVMLAFDFMHLTTSRIGTLEPFSVFSIMVMYLFMIRFYRSSFYDTSMKKLLVLLLLCGISMGLAIAVKWTACYSAVGLAILLFTNLFRRYYEYREAKKLLASDQELTPEERKEAEHITAVFTKSFFTVIAWCFLFFIFIPAVIYWLSYLPDHVWKDDTWSIANVWKQNVYMYQYHSTLEAEHPYQSSWYQWLFDLRPIWYYFGTEKEGVYNSISCFSNPLLTWVGTPCVLVSGLYSFKRKDENAWIAFSGFACALFPWILLVSRCVFAYHFYPSSIFMIMAVCFSADLLIKENRKAEKVFRIYLILYAVLFVIFLPVTAGFGTSLTYIHMLEWLKGWYFG